MIRDFTSKETKQNDGFVQFIVIAPDGRFPQKPVTDGYTYRSALHHFKKEMFKDMIVDMFDLKSQDELKFKTKIEVVK